MALGAQRVVLPWLMTYERPTAIVFIALVWGRTVVLSMLVSLARRPQTTTASCSARWTVARQRSRTRLPQGADLTPRRQSPVLRGGGWRRGGLAAMSTTPTEVSSLSDGRQRRYDVNCNSCILVQSRHLQDCLATQLGSFSHTILVTCGTFAMVEAERSLSGNSDCCMW